MLVIIMHSTHYLFSDWPESVQDFVKQPHGERMRKENSPQFMIVMWAPTVIAQWIHHNIVIKAEIKRCWIEEFTLIVAVWVIRARWREFRRLVLEFKASYFFLSSHI